MTGFLHSLLRHPDAVIVVVLCVVAARSFTHAIWRLKGWQ